MVAAGQKPRNGLSTLIAHAAGLRAHELQVHKGGLALAV